MDRSQLIAFCDYMTGDRVVGGQDAGDPVGTPHSPELRAFIVARLGDLTPGSSYHLVTMRTNTNRPYVAPEAKALAALLREVADGIDPQESA